VQDPGEDEEEKTSRPANEEHLVGPTRPPYRPPVWRVCFIFGNCGLFNAYSMALFGLLVARSDDDAGRA
jgi:hypothetical protein